MRPDEGEDVVMGDAGDPVLARRAGLELVVMTAVGLEAERCVVAGREVSGPSIAGANAVRKVGRPAENPEAIAFG